MNDADIDFLKKMKEITESLLTTKYDSTKVEQLDKMIGDWINELEGK